MSEKMLDVSDARNVFQVIGLKDRKTIEVMVRIHDRPPGALNILPSWAISADPVPFDAQPDDVKAAAIEVRRCEWSERNRLVARIETHYFYAPRSIPEYAAAQIFRLRMGFKMDALSEINAERFRQVHEEGWAPEHDDKYSEGELRAAAACYARCAGEDMAEPPSKHLAPPQWPWADEWWKPSPGNPRRDLVKAAALLIAEIERLDREKAKEGQADD